MGEAGRRQRRVEPTDEWEHLRFLCRWPEQLAYEEMSPLVRPRQPRRMQVSEDIKAGRLRAYGRRDAGPYIEPWLGPEGQQAFYLRFPTKEGTRAPLLLGGATIPTTMSPK